MLVGYARISTDLQTTDGQIDALHAAGCERVFEESMSGTRADRPQLAAALEFAREGDVLVVARLDRLARSMRQLLTTVDTLAGTRHRPAVAAREHRHHQRDRAADPAHLRRPWAVRGGASARAHPNRPGGQPRPWPYRRSSTGFGRHQGHGGEGNAGIRHHDRRRDRPADRVQFIDAVSPCAGWTHRHHGGHSIHGCLISLRYRKRLLLKVSAAEVFEIRRMSAIIASLGS